jgi:carboxymethylenebutenolidase
MGDTLKAKSITISGQNGDQVEAYVAQPDEEGTRGGVVVVHHMPGYDRATKEIVRRFAELGYNAICPNLYFREAPGASPDDAAATARARGGVPDGRAVGDIRGAVNYLRSLATSNGKVGVIGYCSGGRQTVLAACSIDIDAAVDCYGAWVTGVAPEDFPFKMPNLVGQLPSLGCSLLGLFGNDDKHPSPAHVDELEQLLTTYKKKYEIHRYDDAGHAFFAVNRPTYRVAAANDGWDRIAQFFARELSG